MGSAFRVETASLGGASVIKVRGEVDILTTPEVVQHLDAAVESGARHVILDCTELHFMDSKMVEALFRAAGKLQGSDTMIAVACGVPHICRIFDVLGLGALMPICETVDDALASLN